MHNKAGFSLLELSIVLVIIGLLASGVMVGQSLVRGAELRSVMNDHNKILSATNAFKLKYNALPGDMRNATAFWGKDNAACSTDTGTATVGGTCNGNGNNILAAPAGGSSTGEMFQFWKHLSLAGVFEGTFTGLSGPVNWADTLLEVNAPGSKISGAGWSAQTTGAVGSTVFWQLGTDYTFVIFGMATSGTITHGKALTPAEAFNIDGKMDDGKPATGLIISRYWNNECSAPDSGAASMTNLVASYRLSDNTPQCALYFKMSQ